jgi:hypothetical protein
MMDFNGIWNSKDSDDFLRYLKWEAFNFSYFFSMIIVLGIIVYYEFFEFNSMTTGLSIVIGLLLFKRVTTVFLFMKQLTSEKPIHWFRFDSPTVIAIQTLKWSIDIAILVLYWIKHNYANKELIFMATWIDIEIICIFFEQIYFGLIMRYLTTVKPSD